MDDVVYNYKITKGKYRGKIVKSFDSNLYIFGITNPWCACFDDDGNEYVIYFTDLKEVKGAD